AVATNWAGWDSTSAETLHVGYTNLTPGNGYLFAVTGIDEAGAYDPFFSLSENMLPMQVVLPNATGPLLTNTRPAVQFTYPSGGLLDDPTRVIRTEVSGVVPAEFKWSAVPLQGLSITGYRWVLDPVDWHDETPRLGPGDLRHWSDWSPATSVSLGPFP